MITGLCSMQGAETRRGAAKNGLPGERRFGMQQGGGQQLHQQRRIGTGETVLTRWVGHLVVLKYLAGPAMPADPDDPRSLAVGELETRSGIFHLQRYGQ